MAIIGNSDLQTVLDKLSRFAVESVGDPAFAGDFNAGMEKASSDVFSGAGALDTFILGIGDVDVAGDLLSAARDLDETHPTPADGFVLNITGVAAMITALNNHCKRYGPTGTTGLDNYLTGLNLSTPTLRAHGFFKKYLKTISAKNSFIPTDTILATFAATGATTGTYVHVASISTTNYAGAKLVVKNNGAVTTGATLSVTGKKLDGSTQVITATIATGTDALETNLSSVLQVFVDVTAVTITGGTNANAYKIVAKTDRDISAA
jgi:hypothetical protein